MEYITDGSQPLIDQHLEEGTTHQWSKKKCKKDIEPDPLHPKGSSVYGITCMSFILSVAFCCLSLYLHVELRTMKDDIFIMQGRIVRLEYELDSYIYEEMDDLETYEDTHNVGNVLDTELHDSYELGLQNEDEYEIDVYKRTKRNAEINVDQPSKRGQHKNNDRGKDSKRNKKGDRKKQKSFQVESVHMHPGEDEKHIINQVVEEGKADVDCGVRMPQGLQVHCEKSNFWVLDPTLEGSDLVVLANGVIIIQKAGVYLIYSQLTHHDVLGSWSYAIIKESRKGARHRKEETLAQCPGMEPHYHKNQANKVYPVQFQCHTSRVARLRKGDQLYIKNLYFDEKNRVVRLDKPLTFWGLTRLSE